MRLTPDNTRMIGHELDHPECVCVAEDGTVFCGGEAGQVYRITPQGEQTQVACTGGFLLGIALDRAGGVHTCDIKHKAVIRIACDGQSHVRSTGLTQLPFEMPNYGVFTPAGDLLVSDSGEYWSQQGTGRILRIRPDDTTEMFHPGPFRFVNGLAIDPTGHWLYIVQSTAADVVRVPLAEPTGRIEPVFQLPEHTVPDGLCFASDGRLIIGCYKPDVLYLGYPNGRVEVLAEDVTGELLSRPTNAALHGGKLYVANLGGWHLTVLDTDMRPVRF